METLSSLFRVVENRRFIAAIEPSQEGFHTLLGVKVGRFILLTANTLMRATDYAARSFPSIFHVGTLIIKPVKSPNYTSSRSVFTFASNISLILRTSPMGTPFGSGICHPMIFLAETAGQVSSHPIVIK